MLRKYLILVVLIALVFPVAIAHADAADEVFCGDLSQSDCQILLDNAAVMDSLNSFAVSVSMTLDVDSAEPMVIAMQAYGQFELDDESLRSINEKSASVSEAEWGELAEIFLTSAKADVRIEITELSGEQEDPSEFNLLLKDGVVLLGADAMSALSGEAMTGIEGFGIDLNGAIGELLTESGALPNTDSSEMQEMEPLADSAMTIQRLPDSEVNGVAVAVFKTDFDLGAFFALVSPEQLLAAFDDLDDSLTLSEIMDSIEVGEFSITQHIGLDDSYTYGTDIVADMSMSYTESGQAQHISISFDMRAILSNFGEPVDVELPADAFVIPLAMMMQMGN